MKPHFRLAEKKPLALAMLSSLALLTACSDDGNDFPADAGDGSQNGNSTETVAQVIIAGVAADYSSGAVSFLEQDSLTLNENVLATGTDIAVRTFGDHYYLLERFGTNALTKFAMNDPANPIWNFSTEGDDTESNPSDLVFASEDKAYLLRYGTDTAWVVNPSASDEASFKTADLDLSAYDPGDNSVEMTGGLIVDGKLFILMQRLDATYTPLDAYVAVFDTSTDSEIATGAGGELSGVLLPVRNPNAIAYNDADGLIYIQGTGRYAAFDGSRDAELTGGIATLDPTSFATTLLVDDGDDPASSPFGGQISDMALVDGDNGYFISYAGYQDTSLYHFNPNTGQTMAIPAFGNVDISSLAGHDGALYLGITAGSSGTATLSIIDPADQGVTNSIDLSLNPIGMAFTDK